MGVASTHPDYDRMLPIWQKMRDCARGQTAIHAAGEKYLSKLPLQTDEAYKIYRDRALFFNAFFRTTVGLKGMLFRTDPQVELPATVLPMMDDVTLSGVPLSTFGQMLADELFVVSRAGVMADYPRSPDGATQADAQRMNLRPKLALYKAESVYNWQMGIVNNVYTLTQVRLKETATIVIDEFTTETDEKKTARYRVLDLTPEGYRQRLFALSKKGEDILLEEFYPQMGNKNMDYIPFQFFGIDDTTPAVYDPVLCDLADANISHYRTVATKEQVEYRLVPQPVITGHNFEDGETLYMGGAAWGLSQGATAQILEASGAGSTVLENSLAGKERWMAKLGSMILEDQKKQVESAEAQQNRKMGESSVLAAMGNTYSGAMTQLLRWFSSWAGASGDVSYKLDVDFSATGLTPQMLTALVAGWQAGAYSQEMLFDNLKEGKLYPPEATWEEEEVKIREASPVFSGGLE